MERHPPHHSEQRKPPIQSIKSKKSQGSLRTRIPTIVPAASPAPHRPASLPSAERKIEHGDHVAPYSEVSNEEDFFNCLKYSPHTICHCFLPDHAQSLMLHPMLDVLSRCHPKIRFVRANVKTSGYLTRKYALMVFPTLLLFGNARVIGRIDAEDAHEATTRDSIVESIQSLATRILRHFAPHDEHHACTLDEYARALHDPSYLRAPSATATSASHRSSDEEASARIPPAIPSTPSSVRGGGHGREEALVALQWKLRPHKEHLMMAAHKEKSAPTPPTRSDEKNSPTTTTTTEWQRTVVASVGGVPQHERSVGWARGSIPPMHGHNGQSLQSPDHHHRENGGDGPSSGMEALRRLSMARNYPPPPPSIRFEQPSCAPHDQSSSTTTPPPPEELEASHLAHRRRILIVGASSGLGKALALHHAMHEKGGGVTLVLAARRMDHLELVAKECTALGVVSNVHCLSIDVRDAEAIERMKNACVKECGGIDLAYYVAGQSMHSKFANVTEIEHVARTMMDVNFHGLSKTLHAFLPMLMVSKGHFVAISSLAGKISPPYRTLYAAAKHAVQGLLESVRNEMTQVNITVVCPGYLDTPFETKKIGGDGSIREVTARVENIKRMKTEKAAAKIAHAVKNKKKDVYLTKEARAAVSAHMIFPGRINKQLKNEMKKHVDGEE